ncbi:MAG: DUF4118 domain-containing protein, partial [Alphaproteobacteria bacterium]|nr:DUF4118 domain-containing protein [Alphaproteobacteria bacterium]
VSYMQVHAIPGPWAAGERVLACIGGEPAADALVRHARRMADRLHAPWTALHVETARSLRMGEAERNRIAEAMRLAERLGAETVSLPGVDVAETIARYARDNNATHIIVAKRKTPRWLELISGSVTEQLIRRAAGASVQVIGSAQDDPRRDAQRPKTEEGAAEGTDWHGYLVSLGLVAVALGAAELLREALAVSNLSLVFLTAVLASAVLYGLLPSLLAGLASVLLYNFFFLPPLYTFTIADPENVVALFFFAVVAVIASNLTARVRAQAITARLRARTAEELYQFSRKLAVAANLDDLLWATAYQIALMLKVRVVILLPDGASLAVRAGFPPEDSLDEADYAAARWTWEKSRAAGRGADTLPGAKRLFLPMQTGRGAVGVIGIDRDDPGPLLTSDQRRLLEALSDQAALAVERVNLVADVDRAKLAAETERLRGALLTSISHDLRTPLASILGSATALATQGEAITQADRTSLLKTIQEEAERLNRFIGNLLDMTRLESGPVEPRPSIADVSDVVGAALQRAAKILAEYRVEVDFEPNLPMLEVDVVLFEQVLFNLLDNAAKYAPPGSLIRLAAERGPDTVRVRVFDEGCGIPPEDVERIFEKFYRVRGPDRQRAGTGLGLAICRGFIEAMGGTIDAANRRDRSGSVFTITMPVRAGSDLVREIAA